MFRLGQRRHERRDYRGGTRLGGKPAQKVVIGGKGAHGRALADGWRQGFDFVKAAVELVQRGQPDGAGFKKHNSVDFWALATNVIANIWTHL